MRAWRIDTDGPRRPMRLIGATLVGNPPLAPSLYIAINEFTTLFGPNAAGKSTALKALVGALPDIRVDPTIWMDSKAGPAMLYFELDDDAFGKLLELTLAILEHGSSQLEMIYRDGFP